MKGQLFYFSLPVADLAEAKAFYGDLLGWQFDGDGGHIANISQAGGLSASGRSDAHPTLYFMVPEIQAAVARVRELGGEADEPVLYPSGWSANCRDRHGTRFSLTQPDPKYLPAPG